MQRKKKLKRFLSHGIMLVRRMSTLHMVSFFRFISRTQFVRRTKTDDALSLFPFRMYFVVGFFLCVSISMIISSLIHSNVNGEKKNKMSILKLKFSETVCALCEVMNRREKQFLD